MKVGIAVFLKAPVSNRESLMQVAQTAEALGYDWVAPNDRLVHPVEIKSAYPYTDSGKVGAHWLKKDGEIIAESLECLTSVAFLAGCTSRIKIATMVLVLPYRPALLAAKMLATADILSQGRVVAGVSPGWLKEEYDALQNTGFQDRGKILDEYLQAFHSLFNEDYPSFDGEFVKFDNIVFQPKPVEKRVPIWIGGESNPALRRVARYADAWCPASTGRERPMDTVEGFRVAMEALHKACEAEKRDPKTVDVNLLPGNFSRNASGARIPFYGEVAQTIDDIRAYEAEGMTGMTMHFQANDLSQSLENMQRFAEEVMPHIK